MADTFGCPHCGATYPRRPNLVGKAVRCTTCRQPFRLDADGIARPLVAEIEVVEPSAPAPPPAPSAPAQAGTGATSRGQPRSARMEAIRREMSTSLQSALATAIQVEETRAGKESSRIKRASSRRMAAATTGEIGPAALSGEGARAARERRSTWLAIAGLALAIGLIVWWSVRRDPLERALDAWTAPVAEADNRHPRRIQAILDRAWAQQVADARPAPFILLDDERFRGVREMPGPAIARALAGLAGRVWDARLDAWVRPDQAGAAAALLAKTPADLVEEQLRLAEIELIRPAQLRERMEKARLDAAAQELLMALIDPRTGELGARLRDQPQAVAAIAWCEASGGRGLLLYDRGGSYGTLERPWRATLMRVDGQGWPEGWRVLRMAAQPVSR